jgi:hypothetical protein
LGSEKEEKKGKSSMDNRNIALSIAIFMAGRKNPKYSTRTGFVGIPISLTGVCVHGHSSSETLPAM